MIRLSNLPDLPDEAAAAAARQILASWGDGAPADELAVQIHSWRAWGLPASDDAAAAEAKALAAKLFGGDASKPV